MSDALEDRLRAVEDRLAIYQLIASHPPAADTGSGAYYRDAFVENGVMDLGGGKRADGNAAIAGMVATPEHRAAIEGGLCHFAGLPRVTDHRRHGGRHFLFADRHAQPRRAAGRGRRPWHDQRLSHPPRRRQPLGPQTHRARLEGGEAIAAPARRLARGAGFVARRIVNFARPRESGDPGPQPQTNRPLDSRLRGNERGRGVGERPITRRSCRENAARPGARLPAPRRRPRRRLPANAPARASARAGQAQSLGKTGWRISKVDMMCPCGGAFSAVDTRGSGARSRARPRR